MKALWTSDGHRVLLDDSDYDLVSSVVWRSHSMPNRNTVYARNLSVGYMHRLLSGARAHEFVDHIDGNGLNNQRANMRLATRSQNEWNKGRYKNNTSGYKGVSWHKQREAWRASIYVHSKQKHLGLFDTPEEASEAYAEAANKYHGEFARPS